MNQDFSIFTLVTQASLVVQLVMAGLLLASLASEQQRLQTRFARKSAAGEMT